MIRHLRCDQVCGQVFGAVEIVDYDLAFVKVEAADRTVVENEPRFHVMGALPPGEFQHGRKQTDEKPAVADEGDAFLRLTVSVAVAGKQFSEDFVGAGLTIFF